MKRLGMITLLSGLVAVPASGQWTVVNLHPDGAYRSYATGVEAGQQSGFLINDIYRAIVWNGSAPSYVDLTPAESDFATLSDIGGGQQGGAAAILGIQRASLWTGTAASRVDLHPDGALFSNVYGVDGRQQAGHALYQGMLRACMWSGTLASFVDLSPAVSTQAEAYGVDGGQQVGYAIVDGRARPSLWTGTAESWVDLSPPGITEGDAYEVGDGQQVGNVHFTSTGWHASLWTGTADSWVDLKPAGATEAFAYGVDDGQQVGRATLGGVDRACLWSGTAASFVDLHAFVPPEFTASYAYGISHDGGTTSVVGFGFNAATGRIEALLWIHRECQQPVADSGPDVTCDEGALVTLDGSQSSDPNGGALAFEWTQLAGSPVVLDLTEPAHPAFTAPVVALGGETLTFSLVVTNDCPLASEPDIVNVTVANVNHPPVARAGDDQAVAEASPVTLDASDSFDTDGDPLSYGWTQVGGPAVTLDLSDPVHPTFTAPWVGPMGETLVFALTADDGLESGTDSVSVLVENVDHSPTADAGPDQTRNEGAAVFLDATGSSDPDGDALTYFWTQIGGTSVTLSDASSATPSFNAPQVGVGGATLVFRVAVDDGYGGSASDDVAISVQDANSPPACGLARPSLAQLWPPNHKMVAVSILGLTDPDNDHITVTVISVTQDEPVNGLGDGDTAPDAVLQGGSVLLRAERSGSGNGRVYRVRFLADDGHGGQSFGLVTVCVPQDKGKNAPACVDDGGVFNSLTP